MLGSTEEVYPSASDPTLPERRGVSGKVIAEAKSRVSVIDLADRLGAEQGGRWRKVVAATASSCGTT